jgi:hypothetical protein
VGFTPEASGPKGPARSNLPVRPKGRTSETSTVRQLANRQTYLSAQKSRGMHIQAGRHIATLANQFRGARKPIWIGETIDGL